jgi:hypothetical protein
MSNEKKADVRQLAEKVVSSPSLLTDDDGKLNWIGILLMLLLISGILQYT